MRRPARSARSLAPFSVLALCAGLALLPGCYRKVVSARGIAAQGVNVQEPDNPDSRQMQTHPALPASKAPTTRRLVGHPRNAPR